VQTTQLGQRVLHVQRKLRRKSPQRHRTSLLPKYDLLKGQINLNNILWLLYFNNTFIIFLSV
jgi:hypothetical protein